MIYWDKLVFKDLQLGNPYYLKINIKIEHMIHKVSNYVFI
ncbi:MAG: hypothetical protein BAJALOKI3v1_710013 [Promethearchaeota archaeon]|nr:MAG: hypothetical protein BAJALOKI3v1_710013 [Candidatus Lokiarchaeota archaeon]